MNKTFFFLLLVLSCNAHAQERFVDLNGQNFRVKEFGEGDVTVIFECGMSDSLEVWGAIPNSVAKFAHVFLYDRADIGKSDTSKTERTVPNMYADLKNLLDHEKIGSPYVLVGHSMGSYITRYFASQHPDDVKGILLLDPCSEAFWDNMSKKEFQEYAKGGTEWYRTRFPRKYWKEWDSFLANREYMRNLSIPPAMPYILVSATDWNWYEPQSKIIEGFTRARHVLLEGQHHIFKDHPETTVMYIRELVCE